MKNKVLLVVLLVVCACSSGQKHKQYLSLLKEADSINLVYPTISNPILLTQEETQYLKEVLTHDLNIEKKRI
ncbi:hypothetical protein FOE74_16055 [Rufibacter glacialis]|uniref:Uncharacterized protein n=1 Tax=Rufibacter glacialis TaxID=1259555 RepID=A0A5M8Q6S1_9BACT|nr:hypothetical protein FOE74_16055 [Rufibacter glacialis]